MVLMKSNQERMVRSPLDMFLLLTAAGKLFPSVCLYIRSLRVSMRDLPSGEGRDFLRLRIDPHPLHDFTVALLTVLVRNFRLIQILC